MAGSKREYVRREIIENRLLASLTDDKCQNVAIVLNQDQLEKLILWLCASPIDEGERAEFIEDLEELCDGAFPEGK